MLLPVRQTSVHRDGRYLAVGESTVFVPTAVAFGEDRKPCRRDVEISAAGIVTEMGDPGINGRPAKMVPLDENTKESVINYFKNLRDEQPTSARYRLELIY